MEPLAKRGSGGYLLGNGDVLRMGEYHIVAALDARKEQDEPLPAVPTTIHALRPLRRTGDRDIGARLNLEELLVPVIDMDPVLPVSAYGQAVNSGSVQALARMQESIPALLPTEPRRDSTALEAQLPPSVTSESISQRMARLAEAVAREPRIGTSPGVLEDMRTGLEAFCRGAGIAPEALPAEAQGRLLHLAGRLFREAFVGLKDLERTRSETRNRHRIELQPQEADDPRPSLASSVVEDLLIALFVQHEGRRLDSVQWLRESVGEAKAHEQAVAQATRAAFVEFLGRLDPAELEARFERAARRGKARAADKAQYWELFTTFYRNLIEMPADHLPHTFVEAFAAAYREALKKPQS
jgi:type VI secretion system FHA domain protein